MKRLLLFILLIGVCVFCLASCFQSSDAKLHDSIHLTAEERSLLNTSEDDVVLKVFYGDFTSEFAMQKDIETITKDSAIAYWIVHSDGTHEGKKIDNGEAARISGSSWDEYWCELFRYAVSPNAVFDSSVRILEVYCIDSSNSYLGSHIYYVTDHGIYVLIKTDARTEEFYLVSGSDFSKMTKAVVNERILNADLEGITTYDSVWDLEPYVWSPEHLFEP